MPCARQTAGSWGGIKAIRILPPLFPSDAHTCGTCRGASSESPGAQGEPVGSHLYEELTCDGIKPLLLVEGHWQGPAGRGPRSSCNPTGWLPAPPLGRRSARRSEARPALDLKQPAGRRILGRRVRKIRNHGRLLVCGLRVSAVEHIGPMTGQRRRYLSRPAAANDVAGG